MERREHSPAVFFIYSPDWGGFPIEEPQAEEAGVSGPIDSEGGCGCGHTVPLSLRSRYITRRARSLVLLFVCLFVG